MDDGLIGWLAVMMACACFGSFGVPIKHPSVLQANVHPLVFQSYKTLWVFITCWGVLLFRDLHFTWWGVVSGIFWVPGGIAAVVSVTNIGLAVGQGVWSTLIVIVSFSWGVLFFDERMKSTTGSLLALTLLVAGIIGMTFFASPTRTTTKYRAIADERGGGGPPSPEAGAKAQEKNSRKWTLGMGAAIFNGLWGGSNMVCVRIIAVSELSVCSSL
jgi:hypothetical protein